MWTMCHSRSHIDRSRASSWAVSQPDYLSYAARCSASSPAEITQLVCNKKIQTLGCRQPAFVQAFTCLWKVSERSRLC